MAKLRRYTSPSYTLHIQNIDLSGNTDVYVTLRQKDKVQTYTDEDLLITYVTDGVEVPETQIALNLDQVETAAFDVGLIIEVEVNWLSEGKRYATNIALIEPLRNLLEEVLS